MNYAVVIFRTAKNAKANGPDRDRTDDLMNAIHALSQLSYGPLEG